MAQEQIDLNFKSRYEFFFDLLDEAVLSLNQLKVMVIPNRGIEAVVSEFTFNKTLPAFGSLRFDKDKQGRMFVQEFRPGSSAIEGGYFYSFKSERPFWEIVGTLLARINKKRKRHLENIGKNLKSSSKKNVQYCVILQGGLDKKFIQSLLEQGRVSYNAHNEYLREGPLYSALSILSELSPGQIIETKVKNEYNLKTELVFTLASKGRSLNEIACVVGKSLNDDFYTSFARKDNQFPVQILKDKSVPVNIATTITNYKDPLLKDNRLLILDKLTLKDLLEYLKNRKNYYKVPVSPA